METLCSVCDQPTHDYVQIASSNLRITLCQDDWARFCDTAPIDVLENLFDTPWTRITG